MAINFDPYPTPDPDSLEYWEDDPWCEECGYEYNDDGLCMCDMEDGEDDTD